MHKITKIYNTAIYVRLSREDGDVAGHLKNESDSISNQKSLIINYVKSKPDINIIKVYEDDGFSGVFLDRPGFLKMKEAISNADIDCIIVKDLSRLGRNYVEVGRTVEEFIDEYKVRLISINDNIDTIEGDDKAREIIIPFLNICNEQYARDISIKTRGALDIKRKEGQYIGAHAPYGYKKSPENKNLLVIDDEAAEIVRRIYRDYINGSNTVTIAQSLTNEGKPTPLDYKLENGVNIAAPFKIYRKSEWSCKLILRILSNEVYIGTLVQGQVSKRNYKQKKRYTRPTDKWFRFEQAHEPIVSESDFDIVQSLLAKDLRQAPGKKQVYLFAGLLSCGDCNAPMHRYVCVRNGKEYVYYHCTAASIKKGSQICSGHRISETELYNVVLQSIRFHIRLLLQMKELYEECIKRDGGESLIEVLSAKKVALEDKLVTYSGRIRTLYEDVKDGLINKMEFIDFKNDYNQRIAETKQRITEIVNQLEARKTAFTDDEWIRKFEAYRDIEELNRRAIITLVREIYIYEEKRIRIVFNFCDQFNEMRQLLNENNISIEGEGEYNGQGQQEEQNRTGE